LPLVFGVKYGIDEANCPGRVWDGIAIGGPAMTITLMSMDIPMVGHSSAASALVTLAAAAVIVMALWEEVEEVRWKKGQILAT
jgi:hypothetical protein